MADPYLGQIIIFAGDFAPYGWALCNGQLMSVAQNQALFTLLGIVYGGDGKTTFGLPDLRGRVPVHVGQGTGLSTYNLGQSGGVESVGLTVADMPMHNHSFTSSGATVTVQGGDGAGTVSSAGGNYLCNSGDPSGTTPGVTGNIYAPSGSAGNLAPLAGASVNFSAGAIGMAGGNTPHSNIQPFLALNFIIATQGIFPSRQ